MPGKLKSSRRSFPALPRWQRFRKLYGSRPRSRALATRRRRRCSDSGSFMAPDPGTTTRFFGAVGVILRVGPERLLAQGGPLELCPYRVKQQGRRDYATLR